MITYLEERPRDRQNSVGTGNVPSSPCFKQETFMKRAPRDKASKDQGAALAAPAATHRIALASLRR